MWAKTMFFNLAATNYGFFEANDAISQVEDAKARCVITGEGAPAWTKQILALFWVRSDMKLCFDHVAHEGTAWLSI